MVEISSAVVVKLRKLSGQGMMDCKKALEEANGDMDKAVEILRKKGLATMAKRSDRETTQGLVVSKTSADGKTAVMATLCCETDFVARTEDFVATAKKLCDYGLACAADEGIDKLNETVVGGRKLADVITELVSKTGEKTQAGDYARFSFKGSGLISIYIHFNNKVGTMVQLETSDDKVASSPQVKTVAADVAMHITATKPLALDKDGIDPKVVEQERVIYADQVKNKPAAILDKIVDGKMAKFYADTCLLLQPFVKDDSKTVAQVVAEAAKQGGGTAKIVRFVRFEVGGQ
jgi:elongation factor Ts